MSATDAGETTQGREVSFEPENVRARLPAAASDRQIRALICAIRNPDASPYEVAHAAAVGRGEVVRTLSNLAHGVLGNSGGQGQAVERRGEARYAENYAELTDRQRAIVDYRARYDREFDMTGAAVARAINASDEYDVSLDHTTVPSFENRQYPESVEQFVEERRDMLLAQGDLGEDETEADRAAHRLDTRDYLELAGYDLPDENLDTLDRVGDGLDDESRLDLAFERASELDADDEDEPDELPTVRPEDVLDVLDDDEFGDEDVEHEQAYRAVVNGVVEWGVWFTISGDPSRPDDVSGVVPVERLRPYGLEPGHYGEGDEAVVVAVSRSNVGDGKVRHRFALARVEDDVSGVESDGGDEPTETTVEYDEDDHDDESDTSADESEDLGELRERVAALERENERLAAQVDENAEALPTGEQAEKLNEAAATVAEAEASLDALDSRMNAVEDRVNDMAEDDEPNDEADDLAELIRLARSVDGASVEIDLQV